jgi:hypothetical protein
MCLRHRPRNSGLPGLRLEPELLVSRFPPWYDLFLYVPEHFLWWDFGTADIVISLEIDKCRRTVEHLYHAPRTNLVNSSNFRNSQFVTPAKLKRYKPPAISLCNPKKPLDGWGGCCANSIHASRRGSIIDRILTCLLLDRTSPRRVPQGYLLRTSLATAVIFPLACAAGAVGGIYCAKPKCWNLGFLWLYSKSFLVGPVSVGSGRISPFVYFLRV